MRIAPALLLLSLACQPSGPEVMPLPAQTAQQVCKSSCEGDADRDCYSKCIGDRPMKLKLDAGHCEDGAVPHTQWGCTFEPWHCDNGLLPDPQRGCVFDAGQ